MIEYQKGTPTEMGVYAVRVYDEEIDWIVRDAFLLWYEGSWEYLGSDQRYRGEVLGWLGPLARK